ncbi:MAG TPA: hypothetical protein VFV37_10955 [Luteibaculaceae bacterium]|nr:hypothetical protein [Luteibaculaceae bacterium]
MLKPSEITDKLPVSHRQFAVLLAKELGTNPVTERVWWANTRRHDRFTKQAYHKYVAIKKIMKRLV